MNRSVFDVCSAAQLLIKSPVGAIVTLVFQRGLEDKELIQGLRKNGFKGEVQIESYESSIQPGCQNYHLTVIR